MNALQRWTRPANYGGESWPEHFVFIGQHRDSDALTRSNFAVALEALRALPDASVEIVREGHWAVGWVEWLAIHENDVAGLALASDMAAGLADYPVLSEDHFSALEWEEAQAYWERLRIPERVALCQRFRCCVFGARHDSIPHDDNGGLFQYLCA